MGSVYTCMLDTDETGVKVKIPVKVQKVVILGAVVRYDAKVVSAKRDEVLNLAVGGAVRFAAVAIWCSSACCARKRDPSTPNRQDKPLGWPAGCFLALGSGLGLVGTVSARR